MKFRYSLWVLAVTLVIAVVVWFWGGLQTRPNIVLICLDTVRYDIFWLPEESGITDRFSPWAKRALRFDRTQSVSPWTIPSVASAFTGLLPEQHGAGRFTRPEGKLDEETPTGLSEEVLTLAELLREEGYQTANFSSHPWTQSSFGLGQGFAQSFLVNDEAFMEEVMVWLLRVRRRSRQPFFLNLHLMTAHEWHTAALEGVEENLEQMLPELRTAARQSPIAETLDTTDKRFLRYEEYVHATVVLRRRLANLLSALSDLGLLEDSLVMVYSDHGEAFAGERERAPASATAGTGRTHGHGHSLFQELLHVPMLAWFPEQPGRDVDYGASLIDIAPTLLARAGIQSVDLPWLGVDLNRVLEREDGSAAEARRPLFSSSIAYGSERRAVLYGRWKLIGSPSTGEFEVYDLAVDPRERQPMEDVEPALKADLLGLMESLEALEGPAGERPTLSDEMLRRLRALGYLSGAKP